jgi:hypothetical protein
MVSKRRVEFVGREIEDVIKIRHGEMTRGDPMIAF